MNNNSNARREARMNVINQRRDEIRDQIRPLQRESDILRAELDSLQSEIEREALSAQENQSFIALCEEMGAELIQADDRGENAIFEDDGNLFISNGQVVGCFICNQELPRREWNSEARRIIRAFGQFGFSWSMFNR